MIDLPVGDILGHADHRRILDQVTFLRQSVGQAQFQCVRRRHGVAKRKHLRGALRH